MYRVDGELLEEMLDEAERPLTLLPGVPYFFSCSFLNFKAIPGGNVRWP